MNRILNALKEDLKSGVVWAKGLAAAAVGGGVSAAAMAIKDPLAFNLTTGLANLETAAATGAILAGAAYITRSPLKKVNALQPDGGAIGDQTSKG